MNDLKKPYCVLVVVFITLGLYYPAIFAPYCSVDDLKMINSLLNTDHWDLKGLFLPGGSGYYYRPLIGLTFLADKFFWGLEETFMHLENILLHAFNAVLVFFLAARVLARRGVYGNLAPLGAALLFAVHPLNTEAVNWISGRTDPLAGAFLLLSLLCLYAALDRDSLRLAFLSGLVMVVAYLAKETAVFMAPAALFIIFCHHRRQDAAPAGRLQELLYHSIFIGCTGGYFLLRHLAFSRGDTGISGAAQMLGSAGPSHLHSLMVGLKVTGFYARKLVAPWPLNFAIVQVPDYYLLPGIAVICFGLYLLARRREDTAALFVAAMGIASSALLVAINNMAWTPVSERYMYLPLAIAAVAAVSWLPPMLSGRKSGAVILSCVALLAVLFCSSYQRNVVWQSNLALFTDTVSKSPQFAGARNDLAVAMLGKGRTEEAHRIFLTNNDSLDKNFNLARINKALVHEAQGDSEGARKDLLALLEHPGKQEIEILQKLLKVNEARAQKAAPEARAAIALEMVGHLERLQKATADPFCYYRMGQLYLSLQRKKDAKDCFVRACKEAPEEAYYKAPAAKLAAGLALP